VKTSNVNVPTVVVVVLIVDSLLRNYACRLGYTGLLGLLRNLGF
jgi:hypothetical protein